MKEPVKQKNRPSQTRSIPYSKFLQPPSPVPGVADSVLHPPRHCLTGAARSAAASRRVAASSAAARDWRRSPETR